MQQLLGPTNLRFFFKLQSLLSMTQAQGRLPRRRPVTPTGTIVRADGSVSKPFRGVRKRSWGRYVSEIRLPGKKTRVWLGSFASPEMAARAYDSAAAFLRGSSAVLNFPDSADSLPRPESCSREDIQSAAAKAASQVREMETRERWMGGEFEVDGVAVAEKTAFEQVKEAPLLSPLRLGSLGFGPALDEDILWLPAYF